MHSAQLSSKIKWDAATKGKKATTIYYIVLKSITYDLTVCNSGKCYINETEVNRSKSSLQVHL